MTVSAQSRSPVGRYLGVALAVVLGLLPACVSNRRINYPTAKAIGCSPNDVFLSDIASRTSDGDIVETWNAECLGNHYRCVQSKGATKCQQISAEMARQASAAASEPAQQAIGADLAPTIFPLIQRIWNAHRQGDAAAEGALLTDDYTSVHPDGSVHSGKATAQEIQGGPIGSFILSDVRITATSPDTAVANYLATVEIPGAPKLGKFVVSELWVKQGTAWKRRSYQATPVQ